MKMKNQFSDLRGVNQLRGRSTECSWASPLWGGAMRRRGPAASYTEGGPWTCGSSMMIKIAQSEPEALAT